MSGYWLGKRKMQKGFLVFGTEYACIPFAKKGYIIIHQGEQLEKLCRTEATARKYIAEHKKSKSKGRLPGV